MGGEDRRRYFIVGSVFLEIVQPLFRTRLENDYKSRGLGSFQDFLNSQPVMHILFHLRHRNNFCCNDRTNCSNSSKLPLFYCQWNLLYTEKPRHKSHNCHCKFTANPVQLKELDITLASLILLNCCHFGLADKNALRNLRNYKNDYLSHNTEGEITETEYKSLWANLTSFVLQLDPNKQDDLMRIENRPLDEVLCSKYSTDLINIHKKLDELHTGMRGIDSTVQKILNNQRNEAICQYCKKKLKEQGIEERKKKRYKLGRNIFYLKTQNDKPVFSDTSGPISDVVMMDDGRLVICLFSQFKLLICNTDGSQVSSIPVEGKPHCVTAANKSTVAVTVCQRSRIQCIEMYDIERKNKLKSIPVKGMEAYYGITMINNKLVVGGLGRLLFVDHQTGYTVETIETGSCLPQRIIASGDRIFYIDNRQSKNQNLYWYSVNEDETHTLALPSTPCTMTTLKDGSLYVLCEDRSVQHVSFNGLCFKTLKLNQSKFFDHFCWIQYNSNQKKMVSIGAISKVVKYFEFYD